MVNINNQDGLLLRGTLVASRIDSGVTKDEGKAWCARTNMITSGSRVFSHRESGLDPTQEHQPHELGARVVVDVEYARTEAGMTTCGGTLQAEDNGKAK